MDASESAAGTDRHPTPIHLLDSWHASAHEGSGTAVGISLLTKGLRDLGHPVEVMRPRAVSSMGSRDPSLAGSVSLPGRIAFNLRLPSRLRALPPKAVVVGFDIDGWRWSRSRPTSSRYLVSLKGVAADEARFSRSLPERLFLETLAHLERRNAAHADGVLVPSLYSADVAHRTYGIAPERIHVVPEPIDLSVWDALGNAPPPRPDRPTILSVARQYPRKDTDTLLRAFALVRRSLPDARLRVIGGGPELPRLHALARDLILGDAVTFHGPLPDDAEVRKSYFEADLFCLPSRQEGFGIVFLEAMAAGLPIVAVRAGAVPEVVSDGEVGTLVAPGDVEALATALRRLMEDPQMRATFGAAGRHRVRRYDLPRVAQAFLQAVAPTPAGTRA